MCCSYLKVNISYVEPLEVLSMGTQCCSQNYALQATLATLNSVRNVVDLFGVVPYYYTKTENW